MIQGGDVGTSPSSTMSSYRKPKSIGQLTKSFSGFSFTPSQHGSKGKHDCTTRTPSIASVESNYDYVYSCASRMTLRVHNPDPHDSSDEEDNDGDTTTTNRIPTLDKTPTQLELAKGTTVSSFSISTTLSPDAMLAHIPSTSPMQTKKFSTTPTPALVRRQSKTLDETSNIQPSEFLPPLDLTPFDPSHFMPPSSPTQDYFRLSSSPYFTLSTTTDPAPALSTPINALSTREAVTPTAKTVTATISRTPSISESSSLDNSSAPSPPQPHLSTSNTVRTDETSLASLDYNSVDTLDITKVSAANPLLRALLQRDGIDSATTTNGPMTGKTPKPTGSISSKYTKASYSLTNHPDALLLYRDMAKKTGDKTVQYNYAKYLMEIAALYDQGRETKRGTMASIKQSLENAGQRLRQELDHQLGNSAQVTLISPTNSSKHHQYESKSHRRKKRLLEEEGIRWMKQLARDHMPDAAFTLATWMDESKYGFTRNLDKSFALYEIAAKAGIWEATYKMGLYYGKMGDHRHALTYLSKASDLGVVPATLELAKVYLHGKLSQKQDLVLALNHLHKASLDATESCPEPPYMFGQILSNTYPNMDIPRQVVEPYGGVLSSLPYFERAVQLGYAPAHSTLGYILEHGLYGVRVNYAQCYIHYNEAAKKGDAMAMVGLSRLNNQGAHGPTDNDKASFEQRLALDESGWLEQREPHEESAFYWCHKAADQGLADAEALLGWYYEIGLGTIRDLEKAKWYCQKAKVNADQGNRQRLNHKNTMDITTLKTTITTPTLPPYQHHPSLSTFGTPRKESQQCVSM